MLGDAQPRDQARPALVPRGSVPHAPIAFIVIIAVPFRFGRFNLLEFGEQQAEVLSRGTFRGLEVYDTLRESGARLTRCPDRQKSCPIIACPKS